MGKGSKRRQEDTKQINENWDDINWKPKKKEEENNINKEVTKKGIKTTISYK